jgi:hypothetical protein
MPLSDLLIAYLAFGAPLSVYRYLETRGVSNTRRIALSILTFVFWLPFAAGLIVRHFTNASFVPRFVSRKVAGRESFSRSIRQETVRSNLILAGCKLSPHDVREVIERYSGLTELTRGDAALSSIHTENFLKAAGRSTGELGAVCLTRRERDRLESHSEQARESFVSLFYDLPGIGSAVAAAAVEEGIALARELGDGEAEESLATLIPHSRGRNTKQASPILSVTPASPSVD